MPNLRFPFPKVLIVCKRALVEDSQYCIRVMNSLCVYPSDYIAAGNVNIFRVHGNEFWNVYPSN
jgi:hypothetical protein